MTKTQIKRLAKIYAAGLAFNALGAGADSDLMTQADRDALGYELTQLAEKLIKEAKADSEALFIADLDNLIKYILNNNP